MKYQNVMNHLASLRKHPDPYKFKLPNLTISRHPILSRLNGFIAINKPIDWTSNDVIQKVKWNILDSIESDKSIRRNLFKDFKVGHGGTLDPIATGLLVVGFGEACKKFDVYLKGNKEYVSVGKLGSSYDTEDVSGKLLETADWSNVTEEQLRSSISKFIGRQLQKPPAYSAISVNGVRLYDLARSGKEIPNIPARPITIYELEVLSVSLPTFQIRVACSSGTYIRTLIKDISLSVGCVGAMESLVRTRQGNFSISDMISIEDTTNVEKILEKLTIID